MSNDKTPEEIADMVSDCVVCGDCKLKEKCNEIYTGIKSASNCYCIWLDWIQGKIG